LCSIVENGSEDEASLSRKGKTADVGSSGNGVAEMIGELLKSTASSGLLIMMVVTIMMVEVLEIVDMEFWVTN